MTPPALLPLINEWKRTWGVRTARIDALEVMARAMGYETTVPLIELNGNVLKVIERWLRDPVQQRKYLPEPPTDGAAK
jgi:hypothetical protein